MPTRKEVYDIIDGERARQEVRNAGAGKPPYPVYIEVMGVSLHHALTAESVGEDWRVHIRRVAALCVDLMEQHGAPEAEILTQVAP
jgi:hypothetical protein